MLRCLPDGRGRDEKCGQVRAWAETANTAEQTGDSTAELRRDVGDASRHAPGKLRRLGNGRGDQETLLVVRERRRTINIINSSVRARVATAVMM